MTSTTIARTNPIMTRTIAGPNEANVRASGFDLIAGIIIANPNA
jgi:hypothetical protein